MLTKLQILKMMRLSIMAYMPYINLSKESYDVSYDIELLHQIDNKVTDTQGFICYDREHDAICITFRGSVDANDYERDLEFMHKSILVGPDNTLVDVHKGFLDAWRSVEHEIVEFLRTVPTTKKVIFTGHSLGAAIATIGAARLWMYKPELVTFGSPRVGDYKFKKWFKKNMSLSYRVVLNDDHIPCVPIVRYYHIPNMIHLSREGKEIPNWNIFQKLWYWIRGKQRLNMQWHDHSYLNYEKALEKWILY